MQSLQARVDSFKKAKRVKRYPNKSSSSTVSVKWPHPSSFKANANTLAEAGFFFDPSWDDRDSVTCFLCGKELSDWDASDDPFEIHYSKCRSSCAWAVVRCGLFEDLDNDERFVFRNKSRLPSSKAMEKARLETFGEDWWPHDAEPGHGATSVKMAQAGFVYTPQGAGDDTVMCLYCNLSLSGWEKEDDPVQEHRRRDSKSSVPCPLLSLKHTPAPSKPRRKTKAARGKSAKASAPISRRSPSPDEPAPDEPAPHETAPRETAPRETIPHEPAPHEPAPHELVPQEPEPPAIPSIISSPPVVTNSESLSHDERTMTLEQWIRQEIDISCEKLLTDGRRQIDLFTTKAAELRRCIDEL